MAEANKIADGDVGMREGESYLDIVWRQFKKNTPAYISMWLMLPLFVVVIFAPAIASNRPFYFYDSMAARLIDGKYIATLRFNEESARTTVEVFAPTEPGFTASKVVITKLEDGETATYGLQLAPERASRYRLKFQSSDPALLEHVQAHGGQGLRLSLKLQGGKGNAEFGEVLYPWLRSLFNPGQPVDYLFNMALLGFFPWLVLALATNFYLCRKDKPGRRRLGIALAQFPLITVGLCVAFSFDLVRPLNRDKDRTFVKEDFDAGDLKWGVYPLIPFGPTEGDVPSNNQPPMFRKPSSEAQDINDDFIHFFGTDDGGRDVLTRLLYGGRVSMSVGFVAVGIYMLIGVVAGAIAGYFGGIIDIAISRLIEVVLLFPAFFLILTLVGLIGPSIWIIMFVIGITGWPNIARLIRGEVLKQRAIEYVEAARALGVPRWRIIFSHVLPNSLSPALVAAPFGIAGAIIVEAGLSLLGFGVRPPAASWGSILQLGYGNYEYYWLIVFPSLAMFFTVTVFNLVGSGLRDAMDPRLRV